MVLETPLCVWLGPVLNPRLSLVAVRWRPWDHPFQDRGPEVMRHPLCQPPRVRSRFPRKIGLAPAVARDLAYTPSRDEMPADAVPNAVFTAVPAAT
jgi:hypothetical protein